MNRTPRASSPSRAFVVPLLRATLLSVLVLGAGLAGCRGCGETGPEHVLGLVDASAAGIIHVADLAELARGADAFLTRATRKGGPVVAATMRERVEKQLGFDVLSPGIWQKAGIDPAAGAVFFTEGTSAELLLAVGVQDRGLFDAALAKMVERVDGANDVKQTKVGEHTVTVVGRPFGDEVVPVLRWSHVGRFALVTRAAGEAALAAALARLDHPTAPASAPVAEGAWISAEADPHYKELAGKVPAGDVAILARGSFGQLIADLPPVVADAFTSVRLSGRGLSADTHIAVGAQGVAAALAGDPALPLAERIEEDAVLVLLTRAARSEGVAALRTVEPIAEAIDKAVAPMRRRIGIDPEKDALPAFAGPLTVGVHLNDLESLPQRLRTRDIDRILEVVHIAVTAELKDPAAMAQVLARSKEALAAEGTAIRSRVITLDGNGDPKASPAAPGTKPGDAPGTKPGDAPGTKPGDAPQGGVAASPATGGAAPPVEVTIYEPDLPEPRLGWAILGNTYVYGAGHGRLERTLRALHAGSTKLATVLDTTVAGNLAKEKGTSVLVLRAGIVADLAGGAARGAAAGLVGAAVELLRAVGDVAVGVSAQDDGLKITLREQLQ